jgi:hypothetical protein
MSLPDLAMAHHFLFMDISPNTSLRTPAREFQNRLHNKNRIAKTNKAPAINPTIP